jgi:hypothetical protein
LLRTSTAGPFQELAEVLLCLGIKLRSTGAPIRRSRLVRFVLSLVLSILIRVLLGLLGFLSRLRIVLRRWVLLLLVVLRVGCEHRTRQITRVAEGG